MLLKKPVELERLRPYIEHCERYMAMLVRGSDAERCSKIQEVSRTNTDNPFL